jgi:hypothetical protein
MPASAVDQSSDGAAVNDIEATALQRKSLLAKIPDRRRKIHFTVEPGLYGVLIGGDDVGEMSGLERSQMGIDNLDGKHCFIVVATVKGDDLPARVSKQKKGGGYGEPSPWHASRGDRDTARRTEVNKDLLAERVRCFLIEIREIHRRAQRFQRLEGINTLGAALEMALEFGGTENIKFVIEIAMKNGISSVTTHG